MNRFKFQKTGVVQAVGLFRTTLHESKQRARMVSSLSYETDEELTWRATQEVGAFQELYHRYKLPVYRYHFARTGNERVAQDLTSQTFLVALECIKSYKFGGRFVSWLFRIANRELGDYLSEWEHSFSNELAQAINALTDDMAEALTLRFFAGLNPSEIGLVMVKSDVAIKMLVYRGLGEFKARLLSKLEIENV